MLDTKARKYVQPLFEKTADILINKKVTANQLTIAAFITGLIAAFTVFLKVPAAAVILLWISGFLDAVDGTIARKTASSSAIGTLLDILFDRIVEIMVLLAVVLVYPAYGIYTAIVFASIILSMTVFLTVGALAEKKGEKSFYYQPGLAERTEGFIMISLVIVLSRLRAEILLVFAAMILFTAFQRVREAVKILR
jgi:phosphatidylglycerophosphate synthase